MSTLQRILAGILAVLALIALLVGLGELITWAPHWLDSTTGLTAPERAEEFGRGRRYLQGWPD